jgi:MFS family permease
MPGGAEQTPPDSARAGRAKIRPTDGATRANAHQADHFDAHSGGHASTERAEPADRANTQQADHARTHTADHASTEPPEPADHANTKQADHTSTDRAGRTGRANAEVADRADRGKAEREERYKWVALTNTTAAVFMSALDGSIVIIALPAIFRGINLDPLAPGNVFYLLWMIMGYRLVQAVLVVTVGRLGDMFGRVKIYNAGFAVFTAASILLSFDPFHGGHGALWLIGWRVLQAFGGSMLTANSAAILTDAFPSEQRGFALGTNQVAAIAGQFVGLVAGGVLAAVDWRAVFWVNVPVGVFGTLWAYRKLREVGERHSGRIDWWGNATFTVGLSAILIGITVGIQPYHGHAMGWTNPAVLGMIIGGVALLAAFVVIERASTDPMFQLALFRIRAFTAGNIAGLVTSIARGGLQFMLIIWLQGIWLPLHGYSYTQAPFWAGIFLLPLTAGILIAGPTSGLLSDRFGSRGIASAGMLVFGGSFIGLSLLPVDFPYWLFALLIAANGIGAGMFAAPNSSSIMGSVPASQRGAASGMRSTFQNSGTALSIGVFFSLMIAGLASTLPHTLTSGLQRQGVSPAVARQIGTLPPVSSLFAAVLGVNPIKHLLALKGALQTLSAGSRRTLTGSRFFPDLISAPFHHGLIVVFIVATVLAAIAGVASLLRGGRYQAQAATEQAATEQAPPQEVAKK